MRVSLPLLAATSSLLIGQSVNASPSASFGNRLQLSVPVDCNVVRRGNVQHVGSSYDLGELSAYCNAPRGFVVQLSYQPGSLRGATINAGDEQVTLDGSGQAAVMHADGPRISTVELTATGDGGAIDDNGIQFQIIPL